jgi:hypothetical protein
MMSTMTFTAEQQKENRTKWVAALRSGKYEQGKGYLRIGPRHCCLGVACELAKKELDLPVKSAFPEVRENNGKIESDPDGELFYYDGCVNTLPDAVLDWLGIKSPSGRFITEDDFNTSLAGLNDTGLSFGAIARLIEEREAELIR